MRVLISSCSSFYISREAILLARERAARWASDIALWEEEGFLGMVEKPPEIGGTDAEWRKHEEMYSLPDEVPRHDPVLLSVFDTLGGEKMSGWGDDERDKIEVVEIPDDVEYSIHSYCAEWVEERHRRWDTQQGEHLDSWRYFSKESLY